MHVENTLVGIFCLYECEFSRTGWEALTGKLLLAHHTRFCNITFANANGVLKDKLVVLICQLRVLKRVH